MKISHYEWDPENDLIARGGFAEVFKARDENTADRFVAIKIYNEAVAHGTSKSTGQAKYSLEQEFKTVADISHTHVISYYGLDYIQHQDYMGRMVSYPALIMEYATAGTLGVFMQSNPDHETALKILREIILGVQYLRIRPTNPSE